MDAQPPLDPGDKAVDAVADPLGQAVPCALDTVQQAADDVLANMAPLVHAAVPHAHQLCHAGEGGLRQILKTVEDAVHKGGHHGGSTFQNLRQMRDQRRREVCDQASRRRDELGQVIGDADDEALQQLHTGVHDLVCVVAEIEHKLGNDLGGAGEQGGSGVDDALREGCQNLSTGVQHGRHRVGQVLGQLGDDLHAGGHQPGQLLGDAVRQIGDDLSGSGQHGFGATLCEGAGQGADAVGAPLDRFSQGGFQLIIDGQLHPLERRGHDGHSALQIVDLSFSHLPHGTVGVINLGGQGVPLFALRRQQAVDGGEVGLVEQLVDDAVLLALRHAVQGPVQVAQNLVQPTHFALRIVDREPQLLHLFGCFVGRGLEGQDDVAQMGAALRTLDAHVRQQTQGRGQLGGAPLQVGCGAAHRQDGFTQLRNVGIGLAGRHGQLVAEVVHVLLVGLDVQRGHSIGDEVGGVG